MDKVKKLLIIGSVWPEPNSSAAGTRMLQLISLFKVEEYAITFASPAMDSDFMVNLELVGVDKKTITLNCSSFDGFVKDLNPSVVLFDRFMMEEQFGWRVNENCPEALRLLDTEDFHCLRVARQKAFKEKRPFVEADLFVEAVAKREIASILRCDLSLIISEYEMQLLTEIFKIDSSLLLYLPFLLEEISNADIDKLPLFDERNNFVFIGNFLHEPNWNAVQYLKETIWPLIKKQLPEAVVHIYGAYPSQKVLQLNNVKEGFLVKGRAANASAVVQEARVVLAPLRFGAGIKGKLLEAMHCGTPSVTTFIGAESMHGDLDWNGFIADNPEIFANEAVLLYQDEKLWLQAQKNGVEIINHRYLRGLFEGDFMKKIKWLQANLQEHRVNNFMGSLLQHHTLKSTMYMSKWIEEKNRKK
ncbi:glycosyltransferase [Flavobacterium frigoris]|uniref:Glycosyltransferase involved in cell wall bisynthesis n=1 Tax=Flavobacterium frigoris TaxID=229204 RepID=A0A1H9R7R4_FLAFI|nr:glycosyltransferase [Flavobacterium frigoris]SER68728.1 Glycosyltransferase involved in cell wall bisynthesis [Flavobacterium frigoris]